MGNPGSLSGGMSSSSMEALVISRGPGSLPASGPLLHVNPNPALPIFYHAVSCSVSVRAKSKKYNLQILHYEVKHFNYVMQKKLQL